MDILEINSIDDLEIVLENIDDNVVNISERDLNSEILSVISKDPDTVSEKLLVKHNGDMVGVGVLKEIVEYNNISEETILDPDNRITVGDNIAVYQITNSVNYITENLNGDDEALTYFLENININTHIVEDLDIFEEFKLLKKISESVHNTQYNSNYLMVLRLDNSLERKPIIHQPILSYNDGVILSISETLLDVVGEMFEKTHSLTEVSMYKIPISENEKEFVLKNKDSVKLINILENIEYLKNNNNLELIKMNLYEYFFSTNNDNILYGLELNESYKPYKFINVDNVYIPTLLEVIDE